MTTLILVTVVALAAFSLLTYPETRRSVMWGAAWGGALGCWVVGPVILQTHHLQPLTFGQGAIVGLASLIVFMLIGGALAPVACTPLSLWFRFVRAPGDAAAAIAQAAATLLPLAYVMASIAIEWTSFSRFPLTDRLLPVLGIAALLSALIFGLHAFWIRPWIREDADRATRLLRLVLAIAIGGAAVLPLRNVHRERGPAVVSTLVADRASASERKAPLLIIGLDSGNWKTIQPLVHQGRLPTFGRLISEGVHGDIEALWSPYWSAPAWGAIVTGYSPEETGVREDLMAAIPGVPPFEVSLTADPAVDPVLAVEFGLARLHILRTFPAPRNALLRTPVWELLSHAGVKTGVVHFPFTFPAAGQADVVISNRVVTDLWGSLGVMKGDPALSVAPADTAEQWRAWFDAPMISENTLRSILPNSSRPKPADAVLDPVDVLRTAIHTDERMFDAGEEILRRHPDLSVYMHYIAAFDNLCHAFWQYRFPEDYPDHPPAQADVDVLGPVLDRYLEFLDQRIARLIERFPTNPTVILVSDHGHAANESSRLWRGWHSPAGIFIAAGPGIPHVTAPLAVSYYDIVPTMLDLRGFEKPAGVTGTSVIHTAAAAAGVAATTTVH